MRKFLLCCAAALYVCCFFAGCESVKQSYSAFDACRNDPVCFSQMEKGKDLVSSIATVAAGSIPATAPVSNVIGSSVGMLASLLIGVYLGKKNEK